ncbi:MAG: mitochondrial inner membrane protein required for protein import [Sclerophora amabilis]|nr:MAG: mitochondrial inner membrane protein required for protein import [Sclerophora amabilis]
MLLRAAAHRSAFRPLTAIAGPLVPNQWKRGFAKDRGPTPPRRKPTDYPLSSKASEAKQVSKDPGVGRAAGLGAAAQAASVPPSQRDRPSESSDYSNQQEEFAGTSSSDHNTAPRSDGGGPGIPRPQPPNSNSEPELSQIQDEFGTDASSKANTAPQDSSPSAINPTNNTQQTGSSRPLPDLTQGIPSTLESETAGQGHNLGPETQKLNITEDPRSAAGSGGKDGSDLPRSAYISSSERRRNRIANYMYSSFLLLAVTGTVYLGRNWENDEEESKHPEAPSGWGFGLFYNRAKTRLAEQLDYYNEPAFPKLLPDVDPAFERPFTLVLSLEDLLVHSEWSREHGWRMAKRPGVDYFIRYLQQYYELVIFTSTPSFTAEPVIRKLDPYRFVMWPLFREATRYKDGEYIKDLSYLNRDLSKVILMDTVPSHAKLQPENSIILPKWRGDPQDKELVSYIPFLEYVATMGLTDTRGVLKSFDGQHIPSEYAAREKKMRERHEKQLQEEQAKRPNRMGRGLFNSLLGIRSGQGLDGYEQSAAEALDQGKLLQDHFRERAQKNYELLEKEINTNGEKWLKEMAAEDEKMREEQMKGMKSSLTGFFGGGGQK